MTTPEPPGRPDDAVWAPRDGGSGSGRGGPGRAGDDELVAGYHDFSVLARGGDSIVYRARQNDLDRDVAVKVVLLDDPETKARFERELALTVRLGRQHPHIVTVLATGSTRQGQPCLVMDYYELGSLQDRIAERGALPVSDVVTAGSVVADALSFAHAQGVLHRDVKPQNVLVLPTSYVLADFGLARAIDAGHSASLERFSYRHASPQVLDGEAPTTSDDIYSLGSTLYTLLDGRPPFAADDPDEDSALSYLRRARTGEPRELTRADVPPRLAQIVMRCLAKQAADRFPDAAALRSALEAVPTESRSWTPEPQPVTVSPAAVLPLPVIAVADTAFAPPPGQRTDATDGAVDPAMGQVVTDEPVAAEPVASAVLAPPAPVVEPREQRRSAATVEDSSRPAVPDAAPVAVSALAQLDRGAPAAPVDVDVTGLRPVETPPDRPPLGPRRWPLLLVLGAGALVVGLVLGIKGNDSAKPAAQHSTSPASSPTGTPSTSASASFPTPDPVPSSKTPVRPGTLVTDQSIAPRVTKVVRRDGKVILTIQDRSKGVAQLIVVAPDGASHQIPKGAAGITLVDQPSGRICYGVSALASGPGKTFLIGKTRACTTG